MDTSYTITPYERRYRQPTLDLIFHSVRVHTHLDWHETGQWLDLQEATVWLAWADSRLAGVMAVSTPMSGTCWLRLVALRDDVPAASVLGALWEALNPTLQQWGVHVVALLIVNDWLVNHVPALGFRYDEDIVTLRRDGTELPPLRPVAVTVRSAGHEDLQRMTEVDQTAFAAPWQLTLGDLRQARRIAATCTVALHEGEIVGYQLSTLYRQSGHLARLAVMPTLQGVGVGSTLLDDLIRRFLRRGVRTITVNTQASNHRSQRLYARYQFERNGYDLPVWTAEITA
ncbi:MAG: GNAT family N-acetyltransferase [bacterium]|nr:GNAT family N-acetyltransferase [bacterium]